ncbi:MAG: efflux RND transporter periplasmic adaptor subunit [Fimbriimonadales bacterium]|nr:efflux RND transporter periplasmic adaptor subunit [Fimbriimonadales bacterium]
MKRWWLLLAGVVAGVLAYAAFFRGDGEPEIEYRYAPVERKELVLSTSATGQLVPLTTVDVKSKAGGKVIRLAVDEGSRVKAGDLIAVIDPSDTQAAFDQASADLAAAEARALQAEKNYELQLAQTENGIRQARANLETARARFERARIEAERQPSVSRSQLASAQAAYDVAVADQRRLREVTVPQLRRETAANLERARTDLQTAEAALRRARELLAKGYVSQAEVERAESAHASARAAFSTAQQKADTLERDIAAQTEAQDNAVRRAAAALEQAKAAQSDVDLSRRNLEEARANLEAARVQLRNAEAARLNVLIRRSEIEAAKAGTVRSRVSRDNAKVQLDSTTVVAPRDGVVTLKYLEEGTIIPPGTSTFSQGTSIVQISDVTRMFVDCAVDETDIGKIRVGQPVRILAEAYPGRQLPGVVRRINPAATTEQNITAIKVRVEILNFEKLDLRPGMSATCEFILLAKPNVLVAPAQALHNENGRTYVKVKTADPKKPAQRDVKVGESGNDGVEVLEGLKEGEEVVVAEIDLVALRETQRKMLEAQQGGGLAAGGPRPGGGRPGGAGRPAGMGGGGGGRPR